jgi:hypothetical protein
MTIREWMLIIAACAALTRLGHLILYKGLYLGLRPHLWGPLY